MTESHESVQTGAAGAEDLVSEGGLRPPPDMAFWPRMWWWFHFLILVKLARLRFIAILAAIGAVILYWDTLISYYDRWTRPFHGQSTAAAANVEYWCPMHPTIVRDQSDKCPICAMPLSKRKKGEGTEAEEALPPGVVSRVQLSPWKVVNAGVQTVEVTYQPLVKDISTVGFVEYDERKLARITARPSGKSRIDKLHVNVTGQMVAKGEPLAELYSPELLVTMQSLISARSSNHRDQERMARERLHLWGIENDQLEEILRDGRTLTHVIVRSPISGYITRKYQVEGEYVEEGARLYDVADLSTVWIEAQFYEDQLAFLHIGLPVKASAKAYPDRVFTGTVAFIFPFLDTATRTIRVRIDMPNPGNELRRGMYANVTLQVPAVQVTALAANATDDQKQTHSQGLVLAIPERSVIDSGNRKIVYRESEPDVFDGVEVQLGPRCGAFYPVINGLKAGDRVAASGSFLIDAETRLTAGASSTYFGASAGPQGTDRNSATTARPSMTRDDGDKVDAVLAKLSADDRKLAQEQGFCPVLTDNRLGTMGVPVKVLVQGQPVFLCCKGCVNKALADPAQTMVKVAQAKVRMKSAPAAPASPPTGAGGSESAKVKAAMAKLSPDERKQAEEQLLCPVTDEPLGSMGVPLKIQVKEQPVFLCCKGCIEDAQAHPDKTLAKVAELKAKSKSTPRNGAPR